MCIRDSSIVTVFPFNIKQVACGLWRSAGILENCPGDGENVRCPEGNADHKRHISLFYSERPSTFFAQSQDLWVVLLTQHGQYSTTVADIYVPMPLAVLLAHVASMPATCMTTTNDGLQCRRSRHAAAVTGGPYCRIRMFRLLISSFSHLPNGLLSVSDTAILNYMFYSYWQSNSRQSGTVY